MYTQVRIAPVYISECLHFLSYVAMLYMHSFIYTGQLFLSGQVKNAPQLQWLATAPSSHFFEWPNLNSDKSLWIKFDKPFWILISCFKENISRFGIHNKPHPLRVARYFDRSN